MEFDWLDVNIDFKVLSPREIEEAFEDPFSIRLLPDGVEGANSESRFFCLGKTVGSRSVFSVFWTDGKRYRVVSARDMTPEEIAFYERKNAEML